MVPASEKKKYPGRGMHQETMSRGGVEEGGGERHEDHLPTNASKIQLHGEKAPTDHLLNVGRRLQTSKKTS